MLSRMTSNPGGGGSPPRVALGGAEAFIPAQQNGDREDCACLLIYTEKLAFQNQRMMEQNRSCPVSNTTRPTLCAR
jgi:hypothetical protein